MYLSCICFFLVLLGFSRIDLAYFAYDYLVTLVFRVFELFQSSLLLCGSQMVLLSIVLTVILFQLLYVLS